MRLNIGTKVVYREKIVATVREHLDEEKNTYRIQLHDHASTVDPHYKGTVCTIDEIQPVELAAI